MVELNIDENKYQEPLVIDSHNILPGEDKVIKINAGRLPSDTRIYVYAHIYRHPTPGPCVLVLGGVHGDEINGIEIVRRSIDKSVFNTLKKGTVIAIPLLNIYGFINFSRDVPDGKDVNRSFPGSTTGSVASRVARVLSKKILPYVDLALDFHTGGSSRYNYPQIRYGKEDLDARKLAKLFGAPYLVEKPYIPKSFRKVARKMGIPAIVYEAGESIRFDKLSIETGEQGLKNVLYGLDMLEGKPSIPESMITFPRSSWVRAPQSGMFIWSKSSGEKIRKGDKLGVINDPFGTKTVSVISKISGYIIGHNNASVVNQGDALFNIGLEK